MCAIAFIQLAVQSDDDDNDEDEDDDELIDPIPVPIIILGYCFWLVRNIGSGSFGEIYFDGLLAN